MVDEDDAPFQTPSPSTSPSHSHSPPPPPISVVHPSAAPPPNTYPSDSVTVTVATAAPLHQTLTLALPIQPPPGSAAFGGNGREDCWSEGATSALIDAWGERFVELSRGSLKQKQWQEVADVVSSRDDYSKPPRTDAQCKNRIDTLKKKYKLEKTKIAGSGSSTASSWPFFHRLDVLLGNIVKPSPSAPKHPSPTAVATAARSQFPQKQRTSLPLKRKAYLSQQAASASSTSDSFPPEAAKPPPAANGRRGLPAAWTRELTRAILKFGEVYQRVESSKLQQSMEMERQRMGFTRELEMQRMQFFMKTQMELSQLRHRPPSAGARGGVGGSSSSNHHHSRRHHHQSSGPNNNNGI